MLLEWIDPPFCCGHWSPELVRLAGGEEMLGQEGQPSRTLRWEEVTAVQPEVLVLACCGFASSAPSRMPILQGYPGWPDLPCVRTGESMSWTARPTSAGPGRDWWTAWKS